MGTSLHLLRRPVLRQPGSRLAIDWANPITRGLLFSTYNAADDFAIGPIDYVTGRFGSQNTAVGSVVEPLGRFPLFNGSTSVAQFQGLNLQPFRRLTVCWWAYWDSYANNDAVAWAYANTNFASDSGAVADPNGSGGRYALLCGSGGASYDGPEYARPSAAAWHFYTARWDRDQPSAGRQFSIDAVPIPPTGGVSTFGQGSAFGANLKLAFFNAYAGSNKGAGRMANFNIWGRVLHQAEIESMYQNSLRILRGRDVPVFVPTAGSSAPSAQPSWFLMQ